VANVSEPGKEDMNFVRGGRSLE